MNRKEYMKNYYQKKKIELRNKSLIRSHRKSLLKANDIRKALHELLVENKRRRTVAIHKIEYKKIVLYFD
jgi:hypothetical protein